MDKVARSGGVNTAIVLFLIFLVLKLTGTINWSWWWVLSPLWIPWAFWGLILIIWLAAGLFCGFTIRKKTMLSNNIKLNKVVGRQHD